MASGTNTPQLEIDNRHVSGNILGGGKPSQHPRKPEPTKTAITVEYDSDIDPDDLLPIYLKTKAKLFELQPSLGTKALSRPNGRSCDQSSPKPVADAESARLLRKIKQIEDDVLFDKYLANQQWEARRIQLERDAAARRNAAETATQESPEYLESETLVDPDNEVSREAAKIGAAMLEETGSDDDAAIADLFASLPVNEVDSLTGKSTTVVNGSDGVKVTIRDFGKWTGVNPVRVLEEACRSR